ncbi:hypothetical protein C3L33_01744, partial [Rhododendron williamsianum]
MADSPRTRSRSRSISRSRMRGRSRSRSRSRSRGRGRNEVVNPGNTLYVTGLSTRVTERDLEDHFSKEGKIASCFLVVEPRTRASRGFAFISMDTPDDAERCIKRLHQSVLDGRCITVERAIAETAETVETVVGTAEVAMTTSIAGLLLGARRIEVVVVITLLLLDVLLHMEVEGQEGNGRGRFLILRMVVQKGAMVAVLGKAAAYQVFLSNHLNSKRFILTDDPPIGFRKESKVITGPSFTNA